MWWQWILAAGGAIAVLVAGIAIYGSRLPKGHVAACAARFGKSVPDVWRAIEEPVERLRWRKDLRAIDRTTGPGGEIVWVEVGARGKMPLAVVETIPQKRLVVRIADAKLPFGGSWTYELFPDGSGTKLVITENGEIYNPIFRGIARLFIGYHLTMETVLRQLGRHFGETVTPERVA